MITRIATVPGTPLLIPEVASGAAGELDDLRQAAIERVIWAAGDSGGIVVLAQDPSVTTTTRRDLPERVSLAPLGLGAEVVAASDGRSTVRVSDGDDATSVSVLVAAYLSAAAGVVMTELWSIPTDPTRAGDWRDIAAGEGVVVVADGSSTRTPKAPGSLVEGAVDFDDRLAASVRSVDVGYFTDVRRVDDAQRFGVHGLGAWAAAARLTGELPGEWAGQVDVTCDPYGVFYLVAGWSAA